MRNLAEDPAHRQILAQLTSSLVDRRYGTDLDWLDGNRLVGLAEKPRYTTKPTEQRTGRSARTQIQMNLGCVPSDKYNQVPIVIMYRSVDPSPVGEATEGMPQVIRS